MAWLLVCRLSRSLFVIKTLDEAFVRACIPNGAICCVNKDLAETRNQKPPWFAYYDYEISTSN